MHKVPPEKGAYFTYCEECGKSFAVKYPYQVKTRRFCHHKCATDFYAKFNLNRVECVCQHCGKKFQEVPSKVADGRGKFCSKKCHYEHGLTEEVKNKVSEGLKRHIEKDPQAFKEQCKRAVAVAWSHPETKAFHVNRMKGKRGKESIAWKNGNSTWASNVRASEKMKAWTLDVLKRDGFTCRFTGQRGGSLNVHHIVQLKTLFKIYNVKSFEDAMNCEALWDVDNGVTMAESFHIEFHNFWGR